MIHLPMTAPRRMRAIFGAMRASIPAVAVFQTTGSTPPRCGGGGLVSNRLVSLEELMKIRLTILLDDVEFAFRSQQVVASRPF